MVTRKNLVASSAMLIITLLAIVLPACAVQPAGAIDGYTAIIPVALRSGVAQAIPVSLFNGTSPASGEVTLTLLKDGNTLATSKAKVNGAGTVQLNVPDVADGDYQVQVSGPGFQDTAKVAVASSYMVFLETDKPIYKPGQTVRIRVLTLDPGLLPISSSVTVEALDAKGIKIFRTIATTDAYGMATLDLPLSTEPNLGTWKLTATTPKSKTELDVQVAEYVLPKYEVKATLPRDWFLVSEPITGKVSAEYTFGKPVQGELKITASRYVGQWQTYSTVTMPLNGNSDFTIPAAGYVAGVSAAGGQGNVQLEFSVVEKSTGYTEKSTSLLTVSQSSLVLQAIPSGSIFKPGLPFTFLLVSQTPDNKPVNAKVDTQITYFRKDFTQVSADKKPVTTANGKAMITVTPPADAVALTIDASSQGASTTQSVLSGYSPSSNFIHVEQTSTGVSKVGQHMTFHVYSTSEAKNFYYEVISRGIIQFSTYTQLNDISILLTPEMAPSSKLLVYQVLPNAEIAADYLPFSVDAAYPNDMTVGFSTPDAKPGDQVNINISTEGQARVGLVAVDKAVFVLAENRLNLQQVFDQLERLYKQPQAELHDIRYLQSLTTIGATDTFKNAGVVVLSNKTVPNGQAYSNKNFFERGGIFAGGGIAVQDGKGIFPQMAAPTTAATTVPGPAPAGAALADVKRVRQFFPETWLWQDVTTDSSGKATVKVTVPDSITTWMLHAVGISKTTGLGMADAQLKAFQPFFLSVDLPYSAIRGEEFPLSVAIYNYLDTKQDVQVQVEKADWFDLLDTGTRTISIGPNDIGSASFKVKPTKLGTNTFKVTARSPQAADAVVKSVIIDPEGVAREIVDNLSITPGSIINLDASLPGGIVDGSGRVYLALTGSYLAQTIDGLETLLQMPFGCGEQNMIVFAPDVFITNYLKNSGQLKPEIMAKAEKLMLTGYQRELTYRHSDGSFSAFGSQDKEGSIWLTAFVLKSFAQAKGLIFIDDSVLSTAQSWITSHQNADGSFDAVGLVIHKEMMGGLSGKTALTAYIATALMQSGEKTASARAAAYLETKLSEITDPYTMALVSYALETAGSRKATDAYNMLMKMAKEDANGLHWGSDIVPLETPAPGARPPAGIIGRPMPMPVSTTNIEATGYATMALLKHGDNMNAGRAAQWLVSKRNAHGGFGSTQDTVVGLEALTQYASGARSAVDLTVNLNTGGKTQQFKIGANNFDVLQLVELPVGAQVTLDAAGKGQAVGQLVRRFSVPKAESTPDQALKIDVSYDVTNVAVNDLVKVSVDVSFNPTQQIEAGMTVLDISVPTGFAAVADSVSAVAKQDARIKRYDISGRKVIFYIENMMPGDKVHFAFEVKAQYPVSAKGVTSRAYSYYNTQISAETLGKDVSVVAK